MTMDDLYVETRDMALRLYNLHHAAQADDFAPWVVESLLRSSDFVANSFSPPRRRDIEGELAERAAAL